jgi:hypothetical protein
MKFWFDTEFIEDGKTIELLSIGVVSEDGRFFYAEPLETDLSRASAWVKENVFPGLGGPVLPRAEIAAEMIEFMGEKPEIWAYYADYDWVALCQLYGTMMDLPKGWPMICYDLRQWLDMNGHKDVKQPDGDKHNALADATWVAETAKKYGAKCP